jgi:peptidoglycan/LPS O-acetylase OafA/YrhL
MSSDKLPQFILTVLVLAGFAAMVALYMLAPMTDKNADVVKAIITSMGTACLLALGYWFGPSK